MDDTQELFNARLQLANAERCRAELLALPDPVAALRINRGHLRVLLAYTEHHSKDRLTTEVRTLLDATSQPEKNWTRAELHGAGWTDEQIETAGLRVAERPEREVELERQLAAAKKTLEVFRVVLRDCRKLAASASIVGDGSLLDAIRADIKVALLSADDYVDE